MPVTKLLNSRTYFFLVIGLVLLLQQLSRWASGIYYGISFHDVIIHADSVHYWEIATKGYGDGNDIILHNSGSSNLVFYPILPALLKLGLLIHLNPVAWSLILMTTCAVLAGYQLCRLVATQCEQVVAQANSYLWIGQLFGIVLISVLTEPLEALATFSALLFWQQKKYWQSSVCIVLACLIRPSGAALALAIIVSALMKFRDKSVNKKQLIIPLATCFIAPLVWPIYVSQRVHKLDGYFTLQKIGWNNQFDFGNKFFEYAFNSISPSHFNFRYAIVTFISISVAFLIFKLCRMNLPLEWKLISAGTFYLAIAHSASFGSDLRFLTPLGLAFIPISCWLVKRQKLFINLFTTFWVAVSCLFTFLVSARWIL